MWKKPTLLENENISDTTSRDVLSGENMFKQIPQKFYSEPRLLEVRFFFH